MSDLGRWRELAFQKPAHADLPILPGHIRALRPQMNGRLLVEGWMMTRDQPLDGVSVYFNGGHLEDCLLNNDAGVAAAFPDVPHAATREFRFELPIRDHSTNVAPRVDVIGTFRGHPHGRRGQIVSSVLDTLPSSPEELMYRVSHTRDAHSFKVGGLQTLGEFLEPLQRHKSLSQVKRILDWVCGCGRLPMLFLAIIDESPEVWGCDVDPRGVDWCNKALRANAFHTLAPLPPTPYAAEQFDLILSYSVFTHLSRENQEAWLIEMSSHPRSRRCVHGDHTRRLRLPPFRGKRGRRAPSARNCRFHD